MANVIVCDKHHDIFHDILGLPQVVFHSISCTTNVNDLIEESTVINTDIIVIKKSSDVQIRQVITRIASFRRPPKILVVVDKPDIDELEFVLREGALDYIPRKMALEYLQGLLSRPDSILAEENSSSWAEVGERFNILGDCSDIRKCLKVVATASRSDVSVLIHGETGTGKELFARAIHNLSERRDEQLIVVDCASLPASLVESILFGHSKGAFTGADAPSDGLVMRANKGTLFLDEVAELPMELQKKFLRVLQERRFRPVGAKREVASDFRLLAATNKDLSQMVKDGLFRADLLYRLQSLKLKLPPLRERGDDLLKLAEHLINKSCDKNGLSRKTCSKEFLGTILNHDWPGNVRELENIINSVVTTAWNDLILYPEHLPFYVRIKAAKLSIDQDEFCLQDDCEINAPPLSWERQMMPTYKIFRTEILSSTEVQYFHELYRKTQGDIGKAMTIANLSRARIYEFYKKYNITRKVDKGATS